MTLTLTPAEKAAEKESERERRYALDCEHAVRQHIANTEEILGLAAAQQFLIERAIPLNGLTILSSAPGGTKSWLAYDLVMATVRGRDWLGRKFVAAPGEVLILNYDDPTHEIGRRFKQLGAEPSDPIHFHTEREAAFELLRMPAKVEELSMIVDYLRPTLIVINSLRQLHTSDENSSQEMGEVMRGVRTLLRWGASCLLLHHTAKSGATGGSGVRGSGEIPAAADAVIELTKDRDSGAHLAVWAKMRGWDMPELEQCVAYRVADSGAGDALRTRIEVLG